MDSRAQVSFEYLLLLAFSILLVIVATALVLAIQSIAAKSQSQILTVRSKTISTLLT